LRVGRQLIDDATTERGCASATLTAGAATEINGTVERPVGINREPVEGSHAVAADRGVAEKSVDDTLLHNAARLGRYFEDHAVTVIQASIHSCAIEIPRFIDYQVGVGIKTRARSGEAIERALGIRSIRVGSQSEDSAVAAYRRGSPEIARAIKNQSSNRILAILIALLPFVPGKL
jgi:hypothetical protein